MLELPLADNSSIRRSRSAGVDSGRPRINRAAGR
jgi:hypothetical protein